jgi:hypothetical protein
MKSGFGPDLAVLHLAGSVSCVEWLDWYARSRGFARQFAGRVFEVATGAYLRDNAQANLRC